MKTKPKIENVNAKIGTLERRASWLKRKLDRNENGYATSAPADHDREEIEAISGAIQALEYVRG